jgi:hydroxyethylthiazole kinase-like uncharacterized protein yjeF
MTPLRRLLPGDEPALLYDSRASRAIEQAALAAAPPHALIEAAGLAVARLALALAPQAERVWVAAGPGNNGGDGLVAACWLHRLGKKVHVTWLGDPQRLPADAGHARAEALNAGLALRPPTDMPDGNEPPPELVVDALFGLGQTRAPEGAFADTVAALNRCRDRGATLLSVDLPTGLCADTGRRLGEATVRADATLALLTAKPGLFTADGRDAAGSVWWCDLGISPSVEVTPSARLASRADARAALAPRLGAAHDSHKGRFGDTWVVGGARGMVGAAQLAACASLRAGAGRVYLSLLADEVPSPLTATPELMQRSWAEGRATGLADHATVVCGCGGGDSVRLVLPELLGRARRLVLTPTRSTRSLPTCAGSALAARPARRGDDSDPAPARGRQAARHHLGRPAGRPLRGSPPSGRSFWRRGAAQGFRQRDCRARLGAGHQPDGQCAARHRRHRRRAGRLDRRPKRPWRSGLATAACVAAGSAWLHGRAAEDHTALRGLPPPAAT